MLDIAAAAAEVATMVTDLGVPAVVDARDLNLPSAWVTPGEMELVYLDGSADITWDIYLIAQDTGTPDSMNKLSTMLGKVTSITGVDATFLTVNLPNQAAEPLPALLVHIETKVTPS